MLSTPLMARKSAKIYLKKFPKKMTLEIKKTETVILDVKDFMKKDPETGKMLIDMDKIPQKILTSFGFRIPTQGLNSMAALEIVGFLPNESGDLMIFTNSE
jgi:uncharacterized protein YabN with tetrapyrrole methylase and pyrophosphatase domain